MRVLAVPAVSGVVGEETPGVLVVLVQHENAHAAHLRRVVLHILLPDDRQEQGTGRVHHGDVGEEPVAVILLEQFDYAQEEGVLRHGAHGIVGDTCGHGAAHPRGVSEQRIQTTVAALPRVRKPAPKVSTAR